MPVQFPFVTTSGDLPNALASPGISTVTPLSRSRAIFFGVWVGRQKVQVVGGGGRSRQDSSLNDEQTEHLMEKTAKKTKKDKSKRLSIALRLPPFTFKRV